MNSGVYQIKNIINNKIYIGSTKNLTKRKILHFYQLNNNKHHNQYLQNSFNKYGKDSFIFEIIEYCSKKDLFKKEQYYIDTLMPEYNILKIVGSCLGYKHSKKTKEKIRVAQLNNRNSLGTIRSEEFKEKLRQANLGKKLSKETKEKISKSKLGVPMSKEHAENVRLAVIGRKHSNAAKEKMRQSAIKRGVNKENVAKRRKPIVQLTIEGKYIQEFEGIKVAANILNINAGNISTCCRYNVGLTQNKREIVGGFKFMFKKQYEKLNKLQK